MENKLEKVIYLLGMPRASTTFLYHNLQKHPEICVPFRRKTNYFSAHQDKSIGWFLEHFKDMQSNQVGLDTETLHFVDKNLKSYLNIKKLNPNAKVILIVRKPDEWAYSFYKQISLFDDNICSFEEFLNGKYILEEGNKKFPFNYQNGDIQSTIENVIEIFKGNALVIDFKLFKTDSLFVLNSIEKFLNINNHFNDNNFDNKKINASDRKNLKFLTALLRNQFIIDVLSKFPKSIVVFLRSIYDSFTTKKDEKVVNETCPEIKLANKKFVDDIEFYNELFKNNEILYV